MLNKLHMQIKSLERHYGITQRVMILGTDDLNQCSDDKLKAYLEYLRNDGQEKPTQEPKHTCLRPADRQAGTEADIQNPEPSASPDIPETPPPPIAAAPTVQEPDHLEGGRRKAECGRKEIFLTSDFQLDEWDWARKKGIPEYAIQHMSVLWLSGDSDDWTAANDTIFQFTSPFGNKQLCYRRSEAVAIPQIGGRKT